VTGAGVEDVQNQRDICCSSQGLPRRGLRGGDGEAANEAGMDEAAGRARDGEAERSVVRGVGYANSKDRECQAM
jgi:hypothetical protein